MSTAILTDSAGGLSRQEAARRGIDWLPLQIFVGDRQYLDGVDLSFERLYALLAAGIFPVTSQPPVYLTEKLMEEYVQSGVSDIVAVNLAQSMSSTSLMIQAVASRYGLDLYTFDLHTTQAIERYLALAAAWLRDQGRGPAEILEALKNSQSSSNSYLIVENLDHLEAGGRMNPVSAKLSALLGIRPILEISPRTGGRVELVDKARSTQKAIAKCIAKIASELDPGSPYEFFVDSAGSDQEADLAEAMLKERFGADITVHRLHMSALVACHTGLGSLALQYVRAVDGFKMPEAGQKLHAGEVLEEKQSLQD